MDKVTFNSVDEYIAAQPAAVQSTLLLVRNAIKGALPGADEKISYNMPAYKQHGRAVLFFAGWKRHFSLYPAGERLVAEFTAELAPYHVEKGTIRFPLDKPVPVELIERIARFRAAEGAE